MVTDITAVLQMLQKNDKSGGVITTVQEMKENQFGIPLRHYAQQYLFGATGLRLQVFNSIAGAPQSCKSTLLFDLIGHVCSDKATGGQDGIAFLFELEDKISPSLLYSVLEGYGEDTKKGLIILRKMTLDKAIGYMNKDLIEVYNTISSAHDVPVLVGFDSIGGAASSDTVEKSKKEGAIGKGFHEKAFNMKHFCENFSQILEDIPMVIICINQEKESVSTVSYGPPQKHVTGGMSQVFRDGHMISAKAQKLAAGDGTTITLKTTKTSFCDPRKIEVTFRWNKFGNTEGTDDMYGHHFEWALASAKVIADPEKGVGEIRDICDVKISDKNLVTSEKLGLKSVTPEEFEAALFAPENKEILDKLYAYQKIEKIKGMDEYREYLKSRKAAAKDKKPEEKVTVTKTKGRKTAKTSLKAEPRPLEFMDEPEDEKTDV